MLESIKNAVKKLCYIGFLSIEKVQVKKNVFNTYFKLSKSFAENESKIIDLFDSIAFYLKNQSDVGYDKIQKVMRGVTISDVLANYPKL